MDLEALYRTFKYSKGVTIDTREDVSGKLFFALKGEKQDGNRYAREALERGAEAAIVDDPNIDEKGAIQVPNSLNSLQALAHHHRKRLEIPVIAITGSNGKTTTKELCTRVLEKGHELFATPGNLNNHIGLPLSVLRIREDHELALLEFGANHPGENRLLADISQPTHGLVTNIGLDHLEGFGDREGVFKGNKELIDHLAESEGHAFFNADDEEVLRMRQDGLTVHTYGTGEGAELRGELLKADPYIELKWHKGEGPGSSFRTSLIGSYNLPNILAALCIGDHFGIEGGRMEEAIAAYQPDNNRSQVVRTDKNTVILDAYNANPTSMEAAIESLVDMGGKKKGFILGDMLEMGPYEEEVHRRIVELLQEKGLKTGILVGKAFKKAAEGTELQAYENLEEAKERLRQEPLEGSTVLVKGSRGIKLEELLELL